MSLPTDILQPFLAASAAGGRVVRRLVLGFSGGLDSTVLLHLLREPAARHGLPLQVVHVHHGLQAAAEDWVRHADAQCAAWQLPLTVCRVQVPAQASVEAAARRARHEAFAAVLQEGDVLLLAQHGSDQAETVLFRLLRGSGVSGLGAMPAMTQLPGTSFPLWRPCWASRGRRCWHMHRRTACAGWKMRRMPTPASPAISCATRSCRGWPRTGRASSRRSWPRRGACRRPMPC